MKGLLSPLLACCMVGNGMADREDGTCCKCLQGLLLLLLYTLKLKNASVTAAARMKEPQRRTQH
jgi:hypothetical protein